MPSTNSFSIGTMLWLLDCLGLDRIDQSPDLPLRQRKGNHNDRADLGVFFGCGV